MAGVQTGGWFQWTTEQAGRHVLLVLDWLHVEDVGRLSVNGFSAESKVN